MQDDAVESRLARQCTTITIIVVGLELMERGAAEQHQQRSSRASATSAASTPSPSVLNRLSRQRQAEYVTDAVDSQKKTRLQDI